MSNNKVRQYAVNKLGFQVGDGECFALLDEALRDAGDKSAKDYGEVSANADYVWGKKVDLPALMAGDLVQFRNFKCGVVTKTHTKTVQPDGAWSEKNRTEEKTQERPHHSAIVDSVGSGGEVTVLEQNVKNVKKVVTNTLYFSSSETTTKTVTATSEGGTITTTVTVKISKSGTLWFYRPEARPATK